MANQKNVPKSLENDTTQSAQEGREEKLVCTAQCVSRSGDLSVQMEGVFFFFIPVCIVGFFILNVLMRRLFCAIFVGRGGVLFLWTLLSCSQICAHNVSSVSVSTPSFPYEQNRDFSLYRAESEKLNVSPGSFHQWHKHVNCILSKRKAGPVKGKISDTQHYHLINGILVERTICLAYLCCISDYSRKCFPVI